MSRKKEKEVLAKKKSKSTAPVVPLSQPFRDRKWLGCIRQAVNIKGEIISPALDEKEWEVLKS